jgi:ethanolamine ammonia-lyase large subunit
MYAAAIGTRRYVFHDLKTLLAKASPLRSGDRLAGIAAESGEERVAAQYALADLPLTVLLEQPIVPYESDEVTRLIIDRHDRAAFAPVAQLTVGGFRDWLLADETTTAVLSALAPGITPEIAAAVSKLCRLQDLIKVLRGDGVPQYVGAVEPVVGTAAAQSSDRRRQRHCGEHL